MENGTVAQQLREACTKRQVDGLGSGNEHRRRLFLV